VATSGKMKVLGICGTHKKNRKQSASWFLLEKALECCRELGAETDVINLVDYHMLPCLGCNLCMTGETCPQLKKPEDETARVVAKIRWAEGVIFSYPVYGFHPPGVLCNFVGGRGKAFLAEDRAMKGELPFGESTIFTGKIVGSIVNAGGFGMEPALNTFFPAFLHAKALQVACVGTSLGEYQHNPALEQSGMGRDIQDAEWAIEMARSVAKRVVAVYHSPVLPIFKSMLGVREVEALEDTGRKVSEASRGIVWTAEASEQLGKIPIFVRRMAKQRIEEEARARGLSEITVALMLEVKKQMGR
jgi:multimeric flavodoxin WrbA